MISLIPLLAWAVAPAYRDHTPKPTTRIADSSATVNLEPILDHHPTGLPHEPLHPGTHRRPAFYR